MESNSTSHSYHAERIDQVVELLRRSRSLLFITGAGLSADSGLPTYRGIGGLYQNQNAEAEMPIEQFLSSDAFQERPNQTWNYFLDGEAASRHAKPNRGHQVIAEMQSAFDRVWVLTQNVDGFHHQAGSQNVIAIHGDMRTVRCLHCPYQERLVDYSSLSRSPQCPKCQGLIRPDVVLFGEQLPARQLAAYRTEISKGFDLVFSVGSTSLFSYISGPVLDAYQSGKPTVEINPGETEVSELVTVKLPMSAATALDQIWQQYKR
jgi:NAD-dependent deacetylase